MIIKRNKNRRLRVLSAAQWLRTLPTNERTGDATHFQRKYLDYLADIIFGSNDEARRAALCHRNGARLGKPEIMRLFKRFSKVHNPQPLKTLKKSRRKASRKPSDTTSTPHQGLKSTPGIHPVDIAGSKSSSPTIRDESDKTSPQPLRTKEEIDRDMKLLVAVRRAVLRIFRPIYLCFYCLSNKVVVSDEVLMTEFLFILKHFPRHILASDGDESKEETNGAWLKAAKLFGTEDSGLLGDILVDHAMAVIYLINRMEEKTDIEGTSTLENEVSIDG